MSKVISKYLYIIVYTRRIFTSPITIWYVQNNTDHLSMLKAKYGG